MIQPAYEDKIYLDAGDSIGCVELVDHMGSDQRVIDAAHVSFAKTLEMTLGQRWREVEDPKLIRYLISHAHWSPFEHCVITWHVVVPLFVREQWHRHRTWAYNEISRRYSSEALEFFQPKGFRVRVQSSSNKQGSEWGALIDPVLEAEGCQPDWDGMHASEALAHHVQNSVKLYEALFRANVCHEQARMVLPQNMYVRYYGTVNLRNALAFIALREDNHAQWEIFQAGKAMRGHLEKLFPVTLKVWTEIVQKRKEAQKLREFLMQVSPEMVDLVMEADKVEDLSALDMREVL